MGIPIRDSFGGMAWGYAGVEPVHRQPRRMPSYMPLQLPNGNDRWDLDAMATIVAASKSMTLANIPNDTVTGTCMMMSASIPWSGNLWQC